MTNLFVSTARFSAALTLYSIDQLERGLRLFEGDAQRSGKKCNVEETLDSVSEVLMRGTDQQKKKTLNSMTAASQQVVGRTLEGMKVMDPRDAIRASSELLQKTSEVTARLVSKTGRRYRSL